MSKIGYWLRLILGIILPWMIWVFASFYYTSEIDLQTEYRLKAGLLIFCGVILFYKLLTRISILYVIRLAIGAFVLIFGWDKASNPADFAEAISNYQMVPEAWLNVSAYLLITLEITLGLTYLLWLVYEIHLRVQWKLDREHEFLLIKRLSYMYRAHYTSIKTVLHISFIGLLSVFCVVILRAMILTPNIDCGCGATFNPIDDISKGVWYVFTAESNPPLGASLTRNIFALILLGYSWYQSAPQYTQPSTTTED